MSKFFVKSSNNSRGYDIYLNRTDRMPIDFTTIHTPNDSIVRCIAFLNYMIEYNNSQPEVYKKDTAVVVAECVKIFKGTSTCTRGNLLKYFGIQLGNVYDYKTIVCLTRDIFQDELANKHIIAAAKAIVTLRNEEEAKTK